MKKLVLIICMLTCLQPLFAQKPKTKQTVPSKTQINKMLDDLMDQQGLTAEQKAQIRQVAKNGAPAGMPVPGKTATGSIKIPSRQTSRLAAIPKLANTAACEAYIKKLTIKASLKIPASTRQHVDALIAKYQNNKPVLINLGPTLLLHKNLVPAIYAALKGEQANPGNITAKNNLAVILHQAGYPQHAIPILDYLNAQKPQNATILNNLGQCYLSLGDSQKAKTYFMGALRVDANNVQANCGTAFILSNQGLIADAIPYIHKAMKNGYSEVLEDVVAQKNIKLDFDAMKPVVPEYFNPQKYKPVPSATKLQDIGPILTKRLEIEDLSQKWNDKMLKNTDEREGKIKNEGPSQWAARIYGFTPMAPFARRAKFMFMHALDASTAWQVDIVNDNLGTEKRAKEAYKNLDLEIDKMHKSGQGNTVYENCRLEKEILEKYLATSSAIHESILRKTLHQRYDIVNEELHWARYLLSPDEYKALYYSLADWLIRNIAEYNKYQVLYPIPEGIMVSCEKILQNPPKKQEAEDDPDGECPVKIGIPLGAASLKADCEGFEIEGGEFAVFGLERNYRKGEITFSFGLGGELDMVAMSPGAKGQFFFTVGNDYMPLDCGMKFEAGADAMAGPVVIENKVTATMGLTSGINIEAVNNGNEINIFTLDPRE